MHETCSYSVLCIPITHTSNNAAAFRVTPGINVCFNGNCKLPGETVVSAGCASAVSVFSIDYDAPTVVAAPIQAHLKNIAGRSKLPGH